MDSVEQTAPVLNTSTLSQQVFDHLRSGILSNAYPPGTSLPEETLAARFSVSRVPVREALQRLAAEGLVTITPRQGASVSSLSPKQFLDAYRVREALETLAIRLAIPRLTEGDLDRLDAMQSDMRRHAADANSDAFFETNTEFHAVFVDRADNADLKSIHDGLIVRMRRYRSPSLELRGGFARSLEEHAAILQAVRESDADKAAILLAAHIHVPQEVLEHEGGFEIAMR